MSASSVPSSSAASSSAGIVVAETENAGGGFWRRENFGYDVPVINPSVIRHPAEISLETDALIGNLLLALIFAFVIGLSGLLLGHLQETRPDRLKQVLSRLPLQAFVTMLLIWLGRLLIPDALAQGIAESGTSIFRIPVYALLFFVVIGASNTLFNTLIITETERLRGLVPARLTGGAPDLRRKGWFIVLLVALYGLIGGYINPEFHLLPSRQIGIVLVTTTAIIASGYLKDLFSFLLAGKWRYPRWFQANVAGLIVAVGCVALSRAFALDPGYIYGIPVGLLIGAALDRRREGLLEFLSLSWLLVIALLAWIWGPFVEAYPVPADLSNLLFVMLIEDVFIQMLPLPYFAGGTIFRWRRLLWFSQFVIVVFLLFHTLFNPEGTVTGLEQSPPAGAALVLLGCYVALALVLWACVVWRGAINRTRPPRTTG